MAPSTEDTSYRLVNSEVRDLTPELAEEFRNLDPSPTERELNPARLKHLKMKAEAGQLVTFHWSVARLGEKRLRMNGQHSSNMLCGLNGLFPKGLKAHIDEYEVPNKASLALLFRQFDDRKSNRSPGDVASAYQGLYEELHDVPKGPAKMAVEGACWYDRNIEGLPPVSGDDQYIRFGEPGLHGFIRWVGELFTIRRRSCGGRPSSQPCMAPSRRTSPRPASSLPRLRGEVRSTPRTLLRPSSTHGSRPWRRSGAQKPR